MKKYIVLPVLIITIIASGCKNETKNPEPEVVTVDTTQDNKQYEASASEAEFNDPKIAEVFNQYINVKTALVNTDAKAASVAASQLMTAFANVGVEEVALKAAQNIVESDDVEAQRTAFVAVTTSVEQMLTDNLKSGTIYKQYCPMAFDNTGAAWLSNSKDIYNPYFGDKMLKCGRIEAEIK
ncbi:DUF3347 domain-containing protein [Altibacter sp.]|uniref:DUF3347 domain-containing protein n=1 Tax=Altibacter sp. TaxID=2024823 RepID=UPI00258E6314|nr:DUF3347 domain-containing protein [Altibacter sp.]MCW9036376.1 DUF3347 domain-containing protein [Altibacter sp.]